jgi:hypothetical protein
MQTRHLQQELMNWTVGHSGHVARRNYIDLEGIGDCARAIYDRHMTGTHAAVAEHLKMRASYELERGLIARLQSLGVYSPGEEIELLGGLVKGLTDGVIDGRDVLVVETVALEPHLPKDGRLPRRMFLRVQAYLHYLQRGWGQVVYLARETGLIQVYGVKYQEGIGAATEEKVAQLVEAIRTYTQPACVCGRCEPAHK